MNRQQVIELVNFINLNYPNQIRDVDSMIDSWLDTLQQYDLEDVKNKLHQAMRDDRFQKVPPTMDWLLRDLRPIHEKINWNKGVLYCNICGRAFNKREKLVEHEDRCRSVRYVVKQTKKWFGKTLDKKELYEMNKEEFQKKYDELLKVILKNTKNESEKKVIGFIFNQPSPKEALKFLNKIGV